MIVILRLGIVSKHNIGTHVQITSNNKMSTDRTDEGSRIRVVIKKLQITTCIICFANMQYCTEFYSPKKLFINNFRILHKTLRLVKVIFL